MSTDIYKDVNDPDKGLAWPPATDDILIISLCNNIDAQ